MTRFLLVFMMACAATTPVATPTPNVVVEFLRGAERQVETDEQRAELRHALADLARLPPAELRTRRYADYQMQPGRWSAATLLTKYFVPKRPIALDDEAVYRDARAPAARDVIREHIYAIDNDVDAGDWMPAPFAKLFEQGTTWKFRAQFTGAIYDREQSTETPETASYEFSCTVASVSSVPGGKASRITCTDWHTAAGGSMNKDPGLAGIYVMTSEGLWKADTVAAVDGWQDRELADERAVDVARLDREQMLLATRPSARSAVLGDPDAAIGLEVRADEGGWCTTRDNAGFRTVTTCFVSRVGFVSGVAKWNLDGSHGRVEYNVAR